MTEQEWLACTDPTPMLKFLEGKASDRKLRLFACGCCRRIWWALSLKAVRGAVDAAEQHADGFVTDEELDAVHTAAIIRWNRTCELKVTDAAYFSRLQKMAFAVDIAQDSPFPIKVLDCLGKDKLLRANSPVLLRDIIANPFRPALHDPGWLQWNNCTVPKIAQAIYDDRQLPSGHLDATRLAILADALEEASCTDQAILDHCRGPGPHVRGCWVVDLILGKE